LVSGKRLSSIVFDGLNYVEATGYEKNNAVCWFIICILAASCSYSTSVPTITSEATIIPRSLPPPSDHSFGSRWEMVDQSISDDHSFSIIVYAMKLTGHNTIVISSVVSDKIDKLNQPNFVIQLQDNIGDSELISNNSLALVGKINFWVMEFEARNIGASKIALQVGQGNSDANYIKQIAKFAEPPEDPAVFSGRTYMIGASQTFKQDGYRISFEGWGPPPSPVTPSTVEPSGSVAVIDKATLRIENLSTGKIDYLYIQFLSNGQTTSELIQ
jgi:hypothetical protein